MRTCNAEKAPTNTENAGGDLRSLTFMHRNGAPRVLSQNQKQNEIDDKHAPIKEEQAIKDKPAPHDEEEAANEVHVNGSQPREWRALSQWGFK